MQCHCNRDLKCSSEAFAVLIVSFSRTSLRSIKNEVSRLLPIPHIIAHMPIESRSPEYTRRMPNIFAPIAKRENASAARYSSVLGGPRLDPFRPKPPYNCIQISPRICIDLRNDPDGGLKSGNPAIAGRIPCLGSEVIRC